jgi:hypothetical protein
VQDGARIRDDAVEQIEARARPRDVVTRAARHEDGPAAGLAQALAT